MKKINNKGFTLIELLAVVVILLAITVVAIPSINSLIERNKEKRNAAQYKIIESYAEIYYEEHKNKFQSKESFCIEVEKLDLSNDEKTDASGKGIAGIVKYVNGEFKFDSSKNSCNN